MLKRIVSDERGRTLAWTLVVLGIGTLLIPPLLTRISTDLVASRTIEEGLKEQYAADSGVEYALYQLHTGITTGQSSYSLNNKAVDVIWGEYITDTYKITSKATSYLEGKSTTIESYVSLEFVNPPQPLANPLSSPTDEMIQSDGEVAGPAASDDTTFRVHVHTYHVYP